MSLTPDHEEAAGRLLLLNDGAYDPTRNRYGLGRGGNSRGVFVGAMRDVVFYLRGVVAFVIIEVAAIRSIANRFDLAVAAIEAGPVTSVNGQSGAVSIDLSTLSDEIEAEMDGFRTEMAAISKRANSAIAHSLAFGG